MVPKVLTSIYWASLIQNLAEVKEQAFYMRKAIDGDNVRDALKNASNIICECGP